jgi:mannosylglycoprotein endo-beta-mannosidase
LEENCPVYRSEFNFRKVVKIHLEELALAECKYWKKCRIRWIKQGDDNTKFFHAMATERYRRNNISMLIGGNVNEVSDHEIMAGMLLTNFKERMGQSEGIVMEFDLGSLLSKVDGLDELTLLFDKKEMDDVVEMMPVDHAPGPDGFNGMFLKKCWPIIQTEFYHLSSDFHDGKIKLDNINGSYITLVPKKLYQWMLMILGQFH